MNQLEFKRLMRQGRASLAVGIAFLLACLRTIAAFAFKQPGAITKFI